MDQVRGTEYNGLCAYVITGFFPFFGDLEAMQESGDSSHWMHCCCTYGVYIASAFGWFLGYFWGSSVVSVPVIVFFPEDCLCGVFCGTAGFLQNCYSPLLHTNTFFFLIFILGIVFFWCSFQKAEYKGKYLDSVYKNFNWGDADSCSWLMSDSQMEVLLIKTIKISVGKNDVEKTGRGES